MNIPVMGLPILNRYDLAARMEAGVDVEVKNYYVLDNGGGYRPDEHPWEGERFVCWPGFNLGWGAALNFIIKANLWSPWWFFPNADIVFGPGDLERLAEAMWSAKGPAYAFICGYSAFAVNDKAIELVGWFDENYVPCYCEDSDWDWRARNLGVEAIHLESTTTQAEGGSVTIKEPGTRNDYSYPRNKEYHFEKWGGEPWSELFLTPRDEGGDLSVTKAPKLSRLRDQSW